MMEPARKILIIEDNLMLAETYVDLLKMGGFHVLEIAESGEAAIKAAQSERPDLVLVDISLKGRIDGIEASRIIMEKADVPVIFISGMGDDRSRERIRSIPNHRFLMKPVDFRVLEQTIIEMLG